MDGAAPEEIPNGNFAAPIVESPAAIPPAPKSRIEIALAGLQAGMVGVLWMLAWLGVSAAWQKDTFWKPENLFATAFYGGAAYRGEFVHTTFAGISLYLLLYSLLGAGFAVVVRGRVKPSWTVLTAVLVSAAWYYLTFRLLWRYVIPLAYLWHAETPTLIGHLLFGTFLGRFEMYLRDPRPAGDPQPAQPNVEVPVTVPMTDEAAGNSEDARPAPDRSSSPPDLI